jgi:membrane protein DedA with SNARE-associated domain
VVIPFAGFTAWQSDDFTLFGMILAGAIDPVPGALPLYYPGLGGIPGGRTSLRIMTTLQTQHESRYRHVMLFKTTPNK